MSVRDPENPRSIVTFEDSLDVCHRCAMLYSVSSSGARYASKDKSRADLNRLAILNPERRSLAATFRVIPSPTRFPWSYLHSRDLPFGRAPWRGHATCRWGLPLRNPLAGGLHKVRSQSTLQRQPPTTISLSAPPFLFSPLLLPCLLDLLLPTRHSPLFLPLSVSPSPAVDGLPTTSSRMSKLYHQPTSLRSILEAAH